MAHPTGELTVNLHAIAENWRYMDGQLSENSECGAVVKANAYGLGVDRIAPKLYRVGCRSFFVANLKEAIQLQSLLGRDAKIFVLTGCIAGAESEFINRRIIPVIVSYDMLTRWLKYSKHSEDTVAVLKVNTGMGRFGLDEAEVGELTRQSHIFEQAGIKYLMSHLACADMPSHPLNSLQIRRFEAIKNCLREAGCVFKTTLANSAGVFLGKEAHGDIVRPGIALYGGNPGLVSNPLRHVVGLNLPVIQVRWLPAGESVGYGATKSFTEPRLIAVASGGYADGIMRCLSNRGWGYLAGCKVPIVGRVSMDSTIFDITEAFDACEGADALAIEILGDNVSIDDMAGAAGTISYEILTSLGSRYQRCYIE